MAPRVPLGSPPRGADPGKVEHHRWCLKFNFFQLLEYLESIYRDLYEILSYGPLGCLSEAPLEGPIQEKLGTIVLVIKFHALRYF